tara:strand:+ start:50 stop:328 length:279 start_codon:yes stop_codon:yes gene_type:complete
MSYWSHAKNVIGVFTEKDYGNRFEYSLLEDTDGASFVGSNYNHKVWVGGLVNDQGWRYADVKKTVAYVVVDEDSAGRPIVEKWNIKNQKEYV